MQNIYQDRNYLKNFLHQQTPSIHGVVIQNHTTSRFIRQVTIGSVSINGHQIDHISINLNEQQMVNAQPFMPVTFRGTVKQYHHQQTNDGQNTTSYCLVKINNFHLLNKLNNNALTLYQKRRASYMHIPFKKLTQIPNNGQREEFLHHYRENHQTYAKNR